MILWSTTLVSGTVPITSPPLHLVAGPGHGGEVPLLLPIQGGHLHAPGDVGTHLLHDLLQGALDTVIDTLDDAGAQLHAHGRAGGLHHRAGPRPEVSSYTWMEAASPFMVRISPISRWGLPAPRRTYWRPPGPWPPPAVRIPSQSYRSNSLNLLSSFARTSGNQRSVEKPAVFQFSRKAKEKYSSCPPQRVCGEQSPTQPPGAASTSPRPSRWNCGNRVQTGAGIQRRRVRPPAHLRENSRNAARGGGAVSRPSGRQVRQHLLTGLGRCRTRGVDCGPNRAKIAIHSGVACSPQRISAPTASERTAGCWPYRCQGTRPCRGSG